jgi:hypothetical protein
VPKKKIRQNTDGTTAKNLGLLDRLRTLFQTIGPLNLGRAESLVLLGIALRVHTRTEIGFPGNAELARYTGHKDTRHVSRVLALLARIGLIEVADHRGRSGGREHSTRWRVRFDAAEPKKLLAVKRELDRVRDKPRRKAMKHLPRNPGDGGQGFDGVNPGDGGQGLRSVNPCVRGRETLVSVGGNPGDGRQGKKKVKQKGRRKDIERGEAPRRSRLRGSHRFDEDDRDVPPRPESPDAPQW